MKLKILFSCLLFICFSFSFSAFACSDKCEMNTLYLEGDDHPERAVYSTFSDYPNLKRLFDRACKEKNPDEGKCSLVGFSHDTSEVGKIKGLTVALWLILPVFFEKYYYPVGGTEWHCEFTPKVTKVVEETMEETEENEDDGPAPDNGNEANPLGPDTVN